MGTEDLSIPIEQLEAFEDRLGVKLEGIYVSVDPPDEDGIDYYSVSVRGEVHAVSGSNIEADIRIVASVHDGDGRVLETADHWIDSDKFFVLEAFDIQCYPKLQPTKIRIYPKQA